MSRLSVLGEYVSVPMVADHRVVVAPEVPRPEVGLRWGKPSQFELSSDAAPDDDPGGGVVVVGGERKFIGVEVYRAFEILEFVDPTDEEMKVRHERITEALFDFGEFTAERNHPIGPNRVQPIREIIRHYVSVQFTQHQGGSVVVMGERGEKPEDPPPPPPTVADLVRASKNFWRQVIDTAPGVD